MDINVSKELRRFNRLMGEINGTYHEASVKLGLSDSTVSVLYTLCSEGSPCALHEIVRQSGMSKQTINSAIRKLEAEGILYLESVSPKSKNVCLTEAGKHLAAQSAGQIITIENEIFASWPWEDVQKYLELTEAFLRALQKRRKVCRP